MVQPALILNYFGQGALLLANPEAIDNPFYRLYPSWALIPMVVLATVATVIASQAVITGAFSFTRQAIQLGLMPRLAIRHTSESVAGQIYLPRVNQLLFVGRADRNPYLPQFQRACGGLRPVGHSDHGRRQPDGVLRGVAMLGLADLEGGIADGAPACRSSRPSWRPMC